VGLTNLGSELEKCVGSRVHLVGVSISSEKNFYRLPFTPPLWFAVSVRQKASGASGGAGGKNAGIVDLSSEEPNMNGVSNCI
jgi:hypothetical protein